MSDEVISKIEKMIYMIRGHKVMLDGDLANLYDVEVKHLNRAVMRNDKRFPDDFMFQLNFNELEGLRCQFGTANSITIRNYKRRSLPYVFTENGVAMLSSVLHSEKAILVNVSIMRIFTRFRNFKFLKEPLEQRVAKLEKGTNQIFRVIFERLDSIDEIIIPKLPPSRRKIGFEKKET